MKPRTKIEKRVCELSDTIGLSELLMTKVQAAVPTNDWSFVPRAARLRKDRDNVWCHNCGGTFHIDIKEPPCKLVNILDDGALRYPDVTCPHCGKTLSGHHRIDSPVSGSRTHGTYEFVAVGELHGEFQVVRYFHVQISAEIGQPVCVERPVEVVRRWFDSAGHHVVESVGLMCYGWMTRFALDHDLELRREGLGAYSQDRRYVIDNPILLPESSWASWLVRDGFSLQTLKAMRAQLCDIWMFSNPHRVTLIKAGYYALNRVLDDSELKELWYAVKICIRHKYGVGEKNACEYRDYLNMAHQLGWDLHNPVLACPASLQAAHAKANAKIAKRRAAELYQERIKNAALEEENYTVHILPFLGLCLQDGNIVIKPILTVRDVLEEGEAMHHCVFTMGYYKKQASLLLSARSMSSGERVETIEFDFVNGRILQSRGIQNKNTEEHDHIMAMMSHARKDIMRMAKKRNKQTA